MDAVYIVYYLSFIKKIILEIDSNSILIQLIVLKNIENVASVYVQKFGPQTLICDFRTLLRAWQSGEEV